MKVLVYDKNTEKRIGNIFGATGGNHAGMVFDKDYLAPSLSTMQGGLRQPLIIDDEENKKYRIKKLTPMECFVLMGLTFEDCNKAAAVGVSNSQLYKQAGNGIVTNCVELLFEHLYKAQYDPGFVTFDELQTN